MPSSFPFVANSTPSPKRISLYKDVFADEQYCQNPHCHRDFSELSGHNMTGYIRDDTYEDAIADAVS